MTVHEWNASVYHDVSQPQQTWGGRVLERLELAGDERVLDAGCGTGRLTARLAARVAGGRLHCIDRSANMLAVARAHLRDEGFGAARFVHADLSRIPFASGVLDLVFSTATFHWVLDHDVLFAELARVLRPGGRLVAQCGGAGNLGGLHGRAVALIASAEFAPYFRDWQHPWLFADAATTARRLEAAGFDQVDTNLEETPTVFPDAPAFRTFLTTVVLRPFLARLPAPGPADAFTDAMVAQSALDPVPFVLDYWRLNISARRADR